MKLLMLTVFLAIVQTTPPVPQQIANPPATSRNSPPPDIAKDRKAVTVPPESIHQPIQTNNADNDTEEKTERDTQKPVIIRETVTQNAKDWWDRAYVLAGIALVIIGGIGAWLAWSTLRAIERQVHEMGRQTAALNDSVVATKNATDIARASLIATRRPKLVVKRVSMIPGKLVDVNGTVTVEDDLQWRIGVVIANIGASKAHIVESNLTIGKLGVGTVTGLLPSLPPYGKDYSLGEFSIEPGERQEHVVALNQHPETIMMLQIKYDSALRGGNAGATHVVCFGYLHYRDDVGVARRTGFGVEWDAKNMNFSKLDNPEYEYTD